jgi:hypothetical protein
MGSMKAVTVIGREYLFIKTAIIFCRRQDGKGKI